MIHTIEDLTQLIEQSGRPYREKEIMRAYDLAKDAHEGQFRRSGEPYITHPVAVACILVELGMDTDTIVAALLHDVVEDTSVTTDEVVRVFGKEVALLVDGVTKLGKVPLSSKEEEQAENIRKMLLAMAQDVRVIIIKLADRLHNMRTLKALPDYKRRYKSLETMEIYAPLAHRLGIRAVKDELEDLALRYLDPVAYQEIEEMLTLKERDRESFLESIKEKIGDKIMPDHPSAFISGRIKSVYGIYRKIYIQGKSFDEIYDIYAVRIIVDSIEECYNVLGVIHYTFTPLLKRFKDYISTPKPNMYQSLHTTVVDENAIPFEVQIRTWEMHHTAEYGIAAHWKYKAGIMGKDRLEERLSWVRQLLETQQDSTDAQDIVRTIKSDLAIDEVFVYTPKGDVKALPIGSTVIDFAYAIHTAVGNRMTGAKVDGKIVPLDYQVKTGQIIEILTTNAADHGPNRDWLKIVRTSEARNKIRGWFKKERREENVAEGRLELEREFKRSSINLSEVQGTQFVEAIAKRQKFENISDFLAAIGYGGVSLARIMPRIKEEYLRYVKPVEPEQTFIKPKKPRDGSGGVIVEGLDDCLVKFAKCCNPLPGDEIIGFITRGYGVSVHKRDCVNVANSLSDPEQRERWVNTHWSDEVLRHSQKSYKATIRILAYHSPTLLADISNAIYGMHLPIETLNAVKLDNDVSSVQITCTVQNLEQLKTVMGQFSKMPMVFQVERVYQ